MTSITTPLEEAAWVFEHRENYDRQQKFDAAASLSQWGLFSLRQIAAIVGVSHTTVVRVASSKSEKTGGRFAPECLPLLAEVRVRRARGEAVTPDEVTQIVEAGSGTSIGFAARLAGVPQSYLRRRFNQAREDSDE